MSVACALLALCTTGANAAVQDDARTALDRFAAAYSADVRVSLARQVAFPKDDAAGPIESGPGRAATIINPITGTEFVPHYDSRVWFDAEVGVAHTMVNLRREGTLEQRRIVHLVTYEHRIRVEPGADPVARFSAWNDPDKEVPGVDDVRHRMHAEHGVEAHVLIDAFSSCDDLEVLPVTHFADAWLIRSRARRTACVIDRRTGEILVTARPIAKDLIDIQVYSYEDADSPLGMPVYPARHPALIQRMQLRVAGIDEIDLDPPTGPFTSLLVLDAIRVHNQPFDEEIFEWWTYADTAVDNRTAQVYLPGWESSGEFHPEPNPLAITNNPRQMFPQRQEIRRQSAGLAPLEYVRGGLFIVGGLLVIAGLAVTVRQRL